MGLGQRGGLFIPKSVLHRFPQNPPPPGALGPQLRGLLALPVPPWRHIWGLHRAPGSEFPTASTLPRHLQRETLHGPPRTSPLQKKALPATFRCLDGYPPAGWGWGPSRSARGGSPRTEATHVSRRIFFSATTSPVSLFLALYTTPYVPSPIFSTFWKFSMKRWRVGSAGPWGGGRGTLEKADPGSPGRRRGKQGPARRFQVRMERRVISRSCQFVQLETMLPPPSSSPPPPEAPPLLPAFPWPRPQPFLLVNVRAEGRTPRPSQLMSPPGASLVRKRQEGKFLPRGEAGPRLPSTHLI